MSKSRVPVVCYTSVSNPDTVSEYAKLAATALETLGGRVIVGGKPAKTHEAGADQLVVIVEFENLEKAIAAMIATSTGQPSNCSTRPRKEIFVSSKGDDS